MKQPATTGLIFRRLLPGGAWRNAPSRDQRLTDQNLSSAYRDEDTARRAASLRIAIILSVICVPAGVFLDYFVYPERLLDLLWIRVAASLFLSTLLLLLKFRNRRRWIVGLGIATALTNNVAFCAMVYLLGGALSPYYAGINLVLLGMTVLLPWTLRETLAVCAASIGLYMAACFLAGGLDSAGTYSIFFNNLFFLVITSLICVVSSEFQSEDRFQDFELRHRLDQRNHELQELDKLKTNFFSNITHEFRTPLALILGPIDTILKRSDQLDERIHENLMVAQRNSLRLLKLINDLLDLTRIEQGDRIIAKKTIQVGPYLQSIVDSIRHLANSKEVSLRVLPGQTPMYLEADAARLEKVVLNLLTNAIKFTPRGGEVSVAWEADGEDWIALSVRDTGVGIKNEDMEKIFDRFYQVSGEGGSREQGVGIGLALAKQLVEQHEGTLSVTSVPGEGSCFTARLPGAKDARQAATSQEDLWAPSGLEQEADQPMLQAFRSADRTLIHRNTETDEVAISGSGTHRVLVIEDEPDMMRYIAGFLGEHFRLIRARDGRNLHQLVANHQPHLILLDWMLPGKDGLSLCRELRAEATNDTRKIVILTARVDEASKFQALEAGADDFLLKPFSSIELVTRIKNLIRSAELQLKLKASNEELKATLGKLQETEAHLIQSEKVNALGSLSAGLLHEINNPLNYVFSGVQLLEMESDSFDEETREVISDMKEGLGRVNDVMRDLKTFAYPEKPGQTSEFRLLEAFESARKLTSKEIFDIEVEVNLPDTLTLEGQKTQWMHVFVNLLTNAAKALNESDKEGPKRIELHATTQDGKVELVFRDNGPGMPEEIRNRIFEPFFTTRDVGEGMGMGLAICKTIIENHGASIAVESEAGQHTTFTLLIPLSIPEPSKL